MAQDTVIALVIRLKDELSGGLGRAEKRLEAFGKRATQIGRSMSMYLTAPIVALGAIVIKAGADFERSMNKVAALSGATGAQFDALGKQAQELGRTTQFSATEAADAMSFLAMAGFKVEQILGAMPSTLQLAAAAQMDLATAADITSNVLTGYNLKVGELGHVNDVLVNAFTSANVNLQQLGEAMKYAGPIASGMGIGFEEAAGAIAMMGNAGIQGSMAGTALRGALSHLASPTKEAAGVLKRLGIEVTDSGGKMKSLTEIIRELERSGATTKDMLEIFGDRAGPALAALVQQGSAALENFNKKLKESGGIAKSIADKQMEGLHGAILKLKAAIEGLSIAISQSGLLKWMTDLVTALAEWVAKQAELNPELLKWGAILLGIAAAAGPVLIFLGAMIAALTQLRLAVIALTVAGRGLALTPIGAAIVAGVAGGMAINWGLEKLGMAPSDEEIAKARREKEEAYDRRERLRKKYSKAKANEDTRLAGLTEEQRAREELAKAIEAQRDIEDALAGSQSTDAGLSKQLQQAQAREARARQKLVALGKEEVDVGKKLAETQAAQAKVLEEKLLKATENYEGARAKLNKTLEAALAKELALAQQVAKESGDVGAGVDAKILELKRGAAEQLAAGLDPQLVLQKFSSELAKLRAEVQQTATEAWGKWETEGSNAAAATARNADDALAKIADLLDTVDRDLRQQTTDVFADVQALVADATAEIEARLREVDAIEANPTVNLIDNATAKIAEIIDKLKGIPSSIETWVRVKARLPGELVVNYQPPKDIKAYAQGGILSEPTWLYQRGRLVGVAGEAGPEEIRPLRGRGAGGPVNIIISEKLDRWTIRRVLIPEIERAFGRS